MISVGSVVKVVSSSSSHHRRRKFDIQNSTSAEKNRSAREIARKGVSKIQIRYIYLDDANPVILFPAKRPRIFFARHEAS
jgi:hypothetical protein